jgi:hypothetical protein
MTKGTRLWMSAVLVGVGLAALWLGWPRARPDSAAAGGAPSSRQATSELEAYRAAQNQPIEFYGRVVDQDGNGIPGVKVVGRFGRMVGYREVESAKVEKTDAEGLFAFTGISGDGIVFDFEKAGYKLATRKRNFRYSAVNPEPGVVLPTPGNPTVFKMWRTEGPVPTIVRADYLYVPGDGEEVVVDVEKGTAMKDYLHGDIAVSVKWTKLQPPKTWPAEWSLTFRGVGGGVMAGEVDNRVRVPTEGYTSSYVDSIVNDVGNYHLSKVFYYRSHDGKKYAKFEYTAVNDTRKGRARLYLRVTMNPNGSPNLHMEDFSLLINRDDRTFRQKN